MLFRSPGTTCGSCHQKSYCENCHTTGAVKVDHDQMLYNHAADKAVQIHGGIALTNWFDAPDLS